MNTSFLKTARANPDFDRILAVLEGNMPSYRFNEVRRQWRIFSGFCNANDFVALPALPNTILRFVIGLQSRDFRANTIKTYLGVIGRFHREAGYKSPTLDATVLQTVRAMLRREKPIPAKSATPEDFRAVIDELEGEAMMHEAMRRRMQAMAAVGYWGMVNSKDTGTLSMEQLTRESDRWIFTEVGYRKRIIILDRGSDPKYCPIACLERYIAAANVTEGPIWRRIATISGRHCASPISSSAVGLSFGAYFASKPKLKGLTFDSLRTGALEAAFHAGTPYHVLVKRAGFWNERQLMIRLNQIVTRLPDDRILPSMKAKAPALIPSKRKNRPQRRRDI